MHARKSVQHTHISIFFFTLEKKKNKISNVLADKVGFYRQRRTWRQQKQKSKRQIGNSKPLSS